MLKSRQQIKNREFLILGYILDSTKVLCLDGKFRNIHMSPPIIYDNVLLFNHIDAVSYRLLKLRLATPNSNYCIGEVIRSKWSGGYTIRKLKGKPKATKPKHYFKRIVEELRRL